MGENLYEWRDENIKENLVGDGPWKTEPDKAQWIDERSGLDCLIVRGPTGALCGYVGVPESHSQFEKDYDCVDVKVHWGLTYANKCNPQKDPSKGVCHTGNIANKVVWWLGFDCAHSGDFCPKYDRGFTSDETYKDFEFVKYETTQLAEQLIEETP